MWHCLATIAQLGVAVLVFAPGCGGKVDGRNDAHAPSSGGKTSLASGGSSIGGSSTTSTLGSGGLNAAGGSIPVELACGEDLDLCSALQVDYAALRSNVLVLIDKSSSMGSVPSGYTKSKWADAGDALRQALPMDDSILSYGLLSFPKATNLIALDCEVELTPEIAVRPAEESAMEISPFMAEVQPSGLSPTAAALKVAYDYFTLGDGAALVGQKYVLLITDGGPNCNPDVTCEVGTCTFSMDKTGTCGMYNGNCCDESLASTGTVTFNPLIGCLDDALVTAQLDALRLVGIKTYVIGLPGSEPYAEQFDRFAEAGGVPLSGTTRKYYQIVAEGGLASALATITEELKRPCEVPLLKAPMDLECIGVLVDCQPIPKELGDVANWHYDAALQALVLDGAQCESMKSNGSSRVDVVSFCCGNQPL